MKALALSIALACAQVGLAGDGALEAYRAARIVPVDGKDVAPGVLLVRSGRIEGILSGSEEIPAGAEIVDLGDVTVVPGLVNPLSAISPATYRSSQSRVSVTLRAPQDARKSVALASVELEHEVWRRIGRTGYTTIAILPGDNLGLIAGQTSIIRPRVGGETASKDLALRESAYLLIGYSRGGSWYDAAVKTLKGAADKIIKEREEKTKAEEEAKKKAAEEAKEDAEKKPAPQPRPMPPPQSGRAPQSGSGGASAPPAAPEKKPEPPDVVELVFEEKFPAFVRVLSAADFDHFFAFLDSLPLQFDFVLVTGSLPPETVEKLAARKGRIRGVVLSPSLGSLWETSIVVNTARSFIEAGFDVALIPGRDDLDGFRAVFYELAMMVRTGLREKEALRAVTSVPARLLGIESDVGSLRAGNFANFQVFDRDPLSGTARLLGVWVEGKRVFADDAATGELSGEAVR